MLFAASRRTNSPFAPDRARSSAEEQRPYKPSVAGSNPAAPTQVRGLQAARDLASCHQTWCEPRYGRSMTSSSASARRRRGDDQEAPQRLAPRAGLRRHRPGHEEAALPRRDRPGRAEGGGAGREGPDPAGSTRSTGSQPADSRDRRPADGALPRSRARRALHPRRATRVSSGTTSARCSATSRSAVSDGEALDSFYAELRRCRAHCRRGRQCVDHRTRGRARVRRALSSARLPAARRLDDPARSTTSSTAPSTRAVRWRWVGTNPLDQGRAAAVPAPNPQPPTAEQAARDRRGGVEGPGLGHAGLAGDDHRRAARRAVRAALGPHRLRRAACSRSESSIAQHGGQTWEKDTKTHQQRRIALDPQTLALLRAYLVQQRASRRRRSASRCPRTASSSRPTRTDRRGRSPAR